MVMELNNTVAALGIKGNRIKLLISSTTIEIMNKKLKGHGNLNELIKHNETISKLNEYGTTVIITRIGINRMIKKTKKFVI